MNELEELIQRLYYGITCPNCGHLNDRNDDILEAADELQHQLDTGDERRSIYFKLDNWIVVMSAGQELYELVAELQQHATDEDPEANALLFIRELLQHVEQTNKHNRQLQTQLERLKETEPNS